MTLELALSEIRRIKEAVEDELRQPRIQQHGRVVVEKSGGRRPAPVIAAIEIMLRPERREHDRDERQQPHEKRCTHRQPVGRTCRRRASLEREREQGNVPLKIAGARTYLRSR